MQQKIQNQDEVLIKTDRPLQRFVGKFQPNGGEMLTLRSNDYDEIYHQMQLIIQSHKHKKVSNAFIIDVETGDITSLAPVYDRLNKKSQQ